MQIVNIYQEVCQNLGVISKEIKNISLFSEKSTNLNQVNDKSFSEIEEN